MNFQPLGSLLSQWLAQRNAPRDSLPHYLPPLWQEMVGPLLARHCRLVKLLGPVLYVETSAEPWRQALDEQRPFLLLQLKRRLPALSIREILVSSQNPP